MVSRAISFSNFSFKCWGRVSHFCKLGGACRRGPCTLWHVDSTVLSLLLYIWKHDGPSMIKCVFLSGDLTSDYAFYHHTMYFFIFLFFLEWLGLWLGIICQREHGYFCALSFLFRFQNQMPTSYFIQSSKLKAWVLTKWKSVQLYLLRITSLTLK